MVAGTGQTVYRDGIVVPSYTTFSDVSTACVAYTSGGSFDILAQSMLPRATGGCGEVAPIETATNKINYVVLDFDSDTIEYAQAAKIMPGNYDGQALSAKIIWTAATGSGGVIWGIQAVSEDNNESIDTAFGTAAEITDTVVGLNKIHISPSGSFTPGGTPAAGEQMFFQIYRKATDGGDTLSSDARLIGVTIIYGK